MGVMGHSSTAAVQHALRGRMAAAHERRRSSHDEMREQLNIHNDDDDAHREQSRRRNHGDESVVTKDDDNKSSVAEGGKTNDLNSSASSSLIRSTEEDNKEEYHEEGSMKKLESTAAIEKSEKSMKERVMLMIPGPVMSVWSRINDSFWSKQDEMYTIYHNFRCQVFVAVLITSNFLVNIVEAQIGTNNRHVKVFRVFEWFFFFMFWIELLVNAYSSWLRRFWMDAWNVFDFTVVMVATIDTLFLKGNTGGLRILRMMRAFRVFRLFKRVKSLNKIVLSLARALPGMLNALFILFLIMCIYAIVGYNLFHYYPCGSPDEYGPQSCGDIIDDDSLPQGSRWCGKRTSPGYGMATVCRTRATFGHEYFGNFLKSMYTLFQVLTGESWSEVIGRALLEKSPWTAAYFISFILINSVVMINVVVAVLLEKMVVEGEDEEDEDQDDDSTLNNNKLPPQPQLSREDSSMDSSYHRKPSYVYCDPQDIQNVRELESMRRDLREALNRIDHMQQQLNLMTATVQIFADRLPPDVFHTSVPATQAHDGTPIDVGFVENLSHATPGQHKDNLDDKHQKELG